MDVAKSQSENDMIGIGIVAAEYVCRYTGGTVKYIEPVGEFDIILGGGMIRWQVFAFPDMFAPHIKDSNLKQPEDFENYDG